MGPFKQVNQYKSLKGLTAPSKEVFFFSQCFFITAALLGIGSSMRFYFIASSTRVLTYLAAPLLGLRLSAMFVNALTVRSRSYWRKLSE